MQQTRFAYYGLIGAGLLLAYNINTRQNLRAEEGVAPAEAAATVEQPAPPAQEGPAVATPALPAAAQPAAPAGQSEFDKLAKQLADRQAADMQAAEQNARAAAEQQAAQAATEKAAADKTATAQRQAAQEAADKEAAGRAAQARAAAERQATARDAAMKQAADKAAAAKAEAAKQAAPASAAKTDVATTAVPAAAPAAVAAAAAASGAWDGGDAAAGQVVFHKCQLCHYGEKGRTKIGPSLWGVVGRHSGTLEGYHYSTAMASYDHVWTPENLFVYLQAPTKVVHGTKMTFIGLPSETDRANVIAYLKTLK